MFRFVSFRLFFLKFFPFRFVSFIFSRIFFVSFRFVYFWSIFFRFVSFRLFFLKNFSFRFVSFIFGRNFFVSFRFVYFFSKMFRFVSFRLLLVNIFFVSFRFVYFFSKIFRFVSFRLFFFSNFFVSFRFVYFLSKNDRFVSFIVSFRVNVRFLVCHSGYHSDTLLYCAGCLNYGIIRGYSGIVWLCLSHWSVDTRQPLEKNISSSPGRLEDKDQCNPGSEGYEAEEVCTGVVYEWGEWSGRHRILFHPYPHKTVCSHFLYPVLQYIYIYSLYLPLSIFSCFWFLPFPVLQFSISPNTRLTPLPPSRYRVCKCYDRIDFNRCDGFTIDFHQCDC